MKPRNNSVTTKAVYAGMLLAVVVATPFIIVSAQSAKGDQTLLATSISPQSPSLIQAAVEPSDAVEPNADKYTLIFARQYEGRASYDENKPEDNEAFVQRTRSLFDNFVEQLNKAGAQGYKLVSAIYVGRTVGMVKFDGVQYEYDWVMSDDVFAPLSGKDAKYEGLTKRGFRFVKHFQIDIYCYEFNDCRSKYVLLLEKQKGVEKPTPYALLTEYHDKKLVNDDNRGDTHLIFEQRAPDDGKRYEYKVLTFGFKSDFDAAMHKWSTELEPASRETMKTLNSLAKDGFVVRDLFVLDGYRVILERKP